MTEDQERQMVVLLEQVAILQASLRDMTKDRDYYQHQYQECSREYAQLVNDLKVLLAELDR